MAICKTSYDAPHVTFMDPEKSDEKDELVPKDSPTSSYSRPRISSVFFMTESRFAGGIVSRSNYMTRCFVTAWKINTADIPGLQLLLWNGESSRQTLYRAIFGLVILWCIPLIPCMLFLPSLKNTETYTALNWVLLVIELGMLLWHIIVLYVLIENRKNWKRAWFTFEVPSGTIGLVDSGESDELTLFLFTANIRFIKIKYTTISRLYTISKHEQELLEQNMTSRDLEVSEIILYTEDFLNCYSRWPKYMTIALIFNSFGSLFLVLYLLIQQF